jgi:hypothetical protein
MYFSVVRTVFLSSASLLPTSVTQFFSLEKLSGQIARCHGGRAWAVSRLPGCTAAQYEIGHGMASISAAIIVSGEGLHQ